ncbi:hypothetical protein [Microcoleus sp. herbarium14]|uniref:hypothetical protein n=1 Tax=Microcoleus sp. herbarium14 TaxID=3055439 RepID=UPI002FD70E2E
MKLLLNREDMKDTKEELGRKVTKLMHSEVKIRLGRDRKGAAKRLRGLAKTDMPPPTDAEVALMLEECLVEKYLKRRY